MGEFLSVERRGKIAILTMIKPESECNRHP